MIFSACKGTPLDKTWLCEKKKERKEFENYNIPFLASVEINYYKIKKNIYINILAAALLCCLSSILYIFFRWSYYMKKIKINNEEKQKTTTKIELARETCLTPHAEDPTANTYSPRSIDHSSSSLSFKLLLVFFFFSFFFFQNTKYRACKSATKNSNLK